MSILSENLRYLRALKKYSQRQLAEELIIARGRYSKYEDAMSEPPLEILQRIARLYSVSIDLLISSDLRNVPAGERYIVKIGALAPMPPSILNYKK
jgi:transcriptional regulator with XRE-family HTH domain